MWEDTLGKPEILMDKLSAVPFLLPLYNALLLKLFWGADSTLAKMENNFGGKHQEQEGRKKKRK